MQLFITNYNIYGRNDFGVVFVFYFYTSVRTIYFPAPLIKHYNEEFIFFLLRF